MEKLGWKGRLAAVLSALWLLLLYALAPSGDTGKVVAGFGLAPLGLLWGIAWAIQGYRRQHPKADDPEAAKRRKASVLRFFVGVAIFGVGVWYAQSLMGDAVYQEVGYWSVFALICWAVIRSVPKVSSHAVLLTATAFATTLCVQAYRSHLEVSEMKREIAAAAPFLLRANAGDVITDGEISRASTGRWEPFIRASSKYAQEQSVLVTDYSKEIGSLELEKLLDPRVIGTAQGRRIVRERLQRYDQALDRLDGGLKANWQRYFDQAAVLSAQMPRGSGAGLREGLSERYERTRPLVAGWIDSQRKVIAHTRSLSDYLEKLGPRLRVLQSPPNLVFADENDLAFYRSLMEQFPVLAAREEDWQKRILSDERQSAQKLVDFVQTTAR